jgi:hypothetical protein
MKGVFRLVVGLVIAGIVWQVLMRLTGADVAASGPMTCDQLATEAVELSEDEPVELLKVRALDVDLDQQTSGWDAPTGADETVVLRCTGRGVWSDGSKQGVRLELSVDADEDYFVSYQQTR